MPEYVTIGELAAELSMDKSHLRKYVLRAAFDFVKVRTSESRSQLTLALTAEDAEAIREMRQRQGFSGTMRPIKNGNGRFYVIQVVPEYDRNRVKLGFATDVDVRLLSHRTAAPTAEIVGSWPCRASWEATAIASVTRSGCTLVANEVFTCDNLDALVARCDAFFALMPSA